MGVHCFANGAATKRKLVRRFAKVSEEEIEEAFFYPSDSVNTNNFALQGR